VLSRGNPAARTSSKLDISTPSRPRRRATKLTIAIPLAAILIGSTAWANANGKLDGLFRLVRNPVQRPVPSVLVERRICEEVPAVAKARLPQVAQQSEAAAPAPAEDVAAAEPEATDAPAPPDAPAETVAASDEATPPPGRAQVELAAPAAGPAVPSAPAEPEPATSPTPSRADELYRAAHQAHFGAKQPAAALVAWEAYLREAPGGRFALEAQYNRAMCLVRLGRSEAAGAALEPFAEGRLGGYRQADARALLDVLRGGRP
jgi:hypothetical protein